jgi:hypothetical protein
MLCRFWPVFCVINSSPHESIIINTKKLDGGLTFEEIVPYSNPVPNVAVFYDLWSLFNNLWQMRA